MLTTMDGFSMVIEVSMRASESAADAGATMPGYCCPRTLMMFHPRIVPSLTYASIIGGGGMVASSPDTVVKS